MAIQIRDWEYADIRTTNKKCLEDENILNPFCLYGKNIHTDLLHLLTKLQEASLDNINFSELEVNNEDEGQYETRSMKELNGVAICPDCISEYIHNPTSKYLLEQKLEPKLYSKIFLKKPELWNIVLACYKHKIKFLSQSLYFIHNNEDRIPCW